MDSIWFLRISVLEGYSLTGRRADFGHSPGKRGLLLRLFAIQKKYRRRAWLELLLDCI